jgi:hypothetical protein
MELEPQLPSSSSEVNGNKPGDVSADNPFVPIAEFYQSTPPIRELEKEQAWHRTAAFAFALGATAKDVAKQLDRTYITVQNLLRQPWFQKNVTALMAEYGSRDIMELLRAEQVNSLCTLIEIRDNPKAASAARVVCARDILDRTLGKPMQRVEVTGEVASDNPVEEVERLEAEVNRLKLDAP